MYRAGLRQRKEAATLKVIKELDAFPKVPENYQQSSASGGTVSIVSFLLITILVISEIQYYTTVERKYNYEVDTEPEGNMDLNFDITFAMKCDDIGADILDLSGSTIHGEEYVKQEPVSFALNVAQREWLRMFNELRGDLEGYRTLEHMPAFLGDIPTYMPRSEGEAGVLENDGCRVHGTLPVKKVAGNFHITVGKSVQHPRGHAHLSSAVSTDSYNFSHRIDQLSFGKYVSGIINPLDGDLVVADKNLMMYQYYIKIIPTINIALNGKVTKTNQYSVTQRIREINHGAGSHGVSGVFFKYELSPIMVRISEHHRPYWQLLIRLCGIIGGIFATSGMLHDFIGFIVNLVTCQLGKKRDADIVEGNKNELLTQTLPAQDNIQFVPPVDPNAQSEVCT